MAWVTMWAAESSYCKNMQNWCFAFAFLRERFSSDLSFQIQHALHAINKVHLTNAAVKKTLLDISDIWSCSTQLNLEVQAAWNQCYQTQQISAFVQTNIHTSWDLSQINFNQNQYNFCVKIQRKAFYKPQRKEQKKKKRPILSQLLHFLLHFATFSFQKYSPIHLIYESKLQV